MVGWFLRTVIAGAMAAAGVCGQSGPPRPSFTEFEVAAINPSVPNTTGRWIRMLTAHEFAAHNHTLRTLIAAAYSISTRAISGGPAWIDSEQYDITAKAPSEIRPNLEEQMAMLRKLLSDRFGLAIHREEKELPVFDLTVAKGGHKLKDTAVSADANPQGPPPIIFVVHPDMVELPARYATMSEFAAVLQRSALDRPVIDKTGLRGRYDFDLEFTPDETLFGGDLSKVVGSLKPGLFAAMQQQLGLKLEATKGPVEAIVIDRALRPPAN